MGIFLGDVTQWILPGVLLIMLIGLFVMNYIRNKKYQETQKNVIETLKPGDNVKTYSGFYGKIVEVIETTDGKVAILETGSEKNRGYMSIDINAIYAIDEKKPVVYDLDGNVIEDAPVDENPASEPSETIVEETILDGEPVKPVKKSNANKKESK